MQSFVTIKNVSWPHFSWATLYIFSIHRYSCYEERFRLGSAPEPARRAYSAPQTP